MERQKSHFYIWIEQESELPKGTWKRAFQTMFNRKIWFSKRAWKTWAIWGFLALWLLSAASRWLPPVDNVVIRILLWVAVTVMLMAAVIAIVTVLCVWMLKRIGGEGYALELDMREVPSPEEFYRFLQQKCNRSIEESPLGKKQS